MNLTLWKKRLVKWSGVQAIEDYSKQLFLPGLMGFSLYDTIKFIWDGTKKGKLLTRASAISFKILMALAPTAILLFTLIPYIPIDNFQADLIQSIEEMLPSSTFEMVEGTLTDLIAHKHETFLSISFLLGVYYASNSVMAVFEGFSNSHYVQQRLHPVKSRLTAIILVFFLPIFIMPPFLVIAFSEVVLNFLMEKGWLKESIDFVLVFGIKWITVLAFFNLAISILYFFGNPKRKKYKYFTPGSVVATTAFVLVSQGFAYYVNNFGNYNKFYGSLGTIIILLVWIEFNSIILLIGYEMNASLQKATATKNEKLTA